MSHIDTGKGSRRFGLSPRLGLALGGAALLAVGGVAGTVAGHTMQPPIEMAPLHPVAIRALTSDGDVVTTKGRVAEVFGNKFVLDDGAGRALVDTGPAGESGSLAPVGAPLTVQGRFDRGILHAHFLVDAGGKVTALGGAERGRHGPREHGRDAGPEDDRRGPPPPPPGNAPPPPPPGDVAPPPPVAPAK
ncbi:hypothetical protein [Sphingomonas sp. MMS24-J13]|uniref:hypothetical protein n=1 Tax=Sphingomonas sp. MMS24-J13 TaxID=3238686 RepID=UPI00384CEF56